MMTPWSHGTNFLRTPEVLCEMPRDNANMSNSTIWNGDCCQRTLLNLWVIIPKITVSISYSPEFGTFPKNTSVTYCRQAELWPSCF